MVLLPQAGTSLGQLMCHCRWILVGPKPSSHRRHQHPLLLLLLLLSEVSCGLHPWWQPMPCDLHQHLTWQGRCHSPHRSCRVSGSLLLLLLQARACVGAGHAVLGGAGGGLASAPALRPALLPAAAAAAAQQDSQLLLCSRQVNSNIAERGAAVTDEAGR